MIKSKDRKVSSDHVKSCKLLLSLYFVLKLLMLTISTLHDNVYLVCIGVICRIQSLIVKPFKFNLKKVFFYPFLLNSFYLITKATCSCGSVVGALR